MVPTVCQIPDPSRKGGSDEGAEEMPKKRACGELDMEGCIFFEQ